MTINPLDKLNWEDERREDDRKGEGSGEITLLPNSPSSLSSIGQITPTMKSALIAKPITYFLEESNVEQENVVTYLYVYLSEPSSLHNRDLIASLISLYCDRERTGEFISWDLLCLELEIPASVFISAVSTGASLANVSLGKIIANNAIPSVIREAVERAKGSGKSASQDAKLVLGIAGLGGDDKPSVVINNNISNQTAIINKPQKEVISKERLRELHVSGLKKIRANVD